MDLELFVFSFSSHDLVCFGGYKFVHGYKHVLGTMKSHRKMSGESFGHN